MTCLRFASGSDSCSVAEAAPLGVSLSFARLWLVSVTKMNGSCPASLKRLPLPSSAASLPAVALSVPELLSPSLEVSLAVASLLELSLTGGQILLAVYASPVIAVIVSVSGPVTSAGTKALLMMSSRAKSLGGTYFASQSDAGLWDLLHSAQVSYFTPSAQHVSCKLWYHECKWLYAIAPPTAPSAPAPAAMAMLAPRPAPHAPAPE